MNIRKLNEAFSKQYGIQPKNILKESFSTDLKQLLDDEALRLGMSQVTNIKEYEMAFQDAIEKLAPDHSWWEVTDCDIFFDLFQNRDIDGCINRIIDGLKDGFKDSELTEASTGIHLDGKNLDTIEEIACELYKQDGDMSYVKKWVNQVNPDISVEDLSIAAAHSEFARQIKSLIAHMKAKGYKTFGDFAKALTEALTEALKEALTEASISPEDQKDSDMIRGMLAKIQKRSNAKFTPEEQALMNKYGITRDNNWRNLLVGDNNIPLDRDIDHDRLNRDGTPSKINYADRARKTAQRDANQIYKPGYHNTRNDNVNSHKGSYRGTYQDQEREYQNATLREPVDKMKRAIHDRDWNKSYIDNAEATYDSAIAKAKADYDKALAIAERERTNSTTGYHKKWYDRAQGEIDTLLKRDKKEESLQEAANPANAEVNKLIRDIVNGDSRAYNKLRKLGYEVEIDDSARKDFGKEYFGKSIDIINTKTGRKIHADPGHRYNSDDSITARPVEDRSLTNKELNSRIWHNVKPGKYSQKRRNPEMETSFDYKGYLDKPIYDDTEPKTTVQQYKDDKRFVKDNAYTIKKGKEAEQRLSDLRAKMDSKKSKQESLNESNFDVDDIILHLKKEYDECVDASLDFDESLADFIERSTIYRDDCIKWFQTDITTIFMAGMKHCNLNDSFTLDFDDFVRGAISEIVFGYSGEFEEIYNLHKDE